MKVALEIIEMPIGSAVEVGGHGIAQCLWVATACRDQRAGVLERQRRAVRHTDDHPRVTPSGISDNDSQGAGKLARFARKLEITPAGIIRQSGNPHAFDDLVGGETCLEDSGRELRAFERAPSAWTQER